MRKGPAVLNRKRRRMRVATELSKRELEVCALLVHGDTDKFIGKTLGLAEATITCHLAAIFEKTGLDNRVQVAIWWATRTDRAEITALQAECYQLRRQRDNYKMWFPMGSKA